jgi:hypothetical protein
MDALYYWKNFDTDIKAGRIGYFKSGAHKLKELQDGFPDFIWVIRTPAGRKGQGQILARLKWIDVPPEHVKVDRSHVCIYYDPDDLGSVYFLDSDSEPAINATTDWVGRHFPKMLAINSQGTAGTEALRGAALAELKTLSEAFRRKPFSAIAERL